MTTDLAFDNDYATFVQRVRRLAGIDLTGYKPEQMRRRLLALAQRHGQPSLTGFALAMEREPAALNAFKNFFTINVSEFLRDPARWNDLTARILPELVRGAGGRPLKIWSAGCSYGAEPYTLALLLTELRPTPPFRILATDIDETILARACAGAGYLENDLRNLDEARRAAAFSREADGSYTVKPALRARVHFQRHDLLGEAPDGGFDLIVCRNVVIYFTEEAKRVLYKRLFEALRPGGVLFVGGTEVVSGARELGFEPFQTSFYRRGGVCVPALR
jgi:chemotaxis protein methyltransferase CheR